jgi:hypothetical protein
MRSTNQGPAQPPLAASIAIVGLAHDERAAQLDAFHLQLLLTFISYINTAYSRT